MLLNSRWTGKAINLKRYLQYTSLDDGNLEFLTAATSQVE